NADRPLKRSKPERGAAGKSASRYLLRRNCKPTMSNTISPFCPVGCYGKLKRSLLQSIIILTVPFFWSDSAAAAEGKKIVFIAGSPSHGPGEHEPRAGCLLLKSCLDQLPFVNSVVYSNGWPENAAEAFKNAATIVVYSDGGGGHPLLRDDRLKIVG